MKIDYDIVVGLNCLFIELSNSFKSAISGIGLIIFLLWLICSRDLNLNQTRRK